MDNTRTIQLQWRIRKLTDEINRLSTQLASANDAFAEELRCLPLEAKQQGQDGNLISWRKEVPPRGARH